MNKVGKLQLPGPRDYLSLALLAGFVFNCQAENSSTAQHTQISEDRYYLEAKCPPEGIQELVLRRNQRFELTSFLSKTKKRERKASGEWRLEDESLSLVTEQQSMRFAVKSRVHTLVGEKFLYLSFKAVPTEKPHMLNECEFVDRRVLTHFLQANPKPAAKAARDLPEHDEQQQSK